ncbi:hypothetical protein CFR73_09930 [Novacetimonas maltaceti]|nr:hypothetical protein CFR73_09930 [Novacetimonas maltaceti]
MGPQHRLKRLLRGRTRAGIGHGGPPSSFFHERAQAGQWPVFLKNGRHRCNFRGLRGLSRPRGAPLTE